MKIIKKALRLESLEYYKKHLAIVDAILQVGFTKRELEFIAEFMLVDETFEDTFSSKNCDIVAKKLGVSKQTISNFVASMKKKSVIKKDGGKWRFKYVFIPTDNVQQYQIAIINNDKI